MVTATFNYKVTLDLARRTNPVIDIKVESTNFAESKTAIKAIAQELVGEAGARGVQKIDLVNGHEILGFIQIPV